MSALQVDRLAAAVEWRLLGLLLSRPRAGWAEQLAALSRETRDELLRAAASAARGASEGGYHAFLGAGAAASPREAANGAFLDPGRTLADLRACYQAFGFAPETEEPDDHLSVECDFVAYLLLKQAYADARGQDEEADIARDARERFIAEHVAAVGRRFAGALPLVAPEHLVLAARALAARLPEVPQTPPRCAVDPLEGGCAMECAR